MRTSSLCRFVLPAAAAFFTILYASVAHAQSQLNVRDPNASFLNIPARRAALALNITDPRLQQAIAQVRSCVASPIPPPPPPGQDIPRTTSTTATAPPIP
jgi:hypothetical protein